MAVVTIPNFSRARLPELLGLLPDLKLHYAQGDRDHGRSVVAFSGERQLVVEGLLAVARRLLPELDLSPGSGLHPAGVHPHVGALDVAPFVDLEPGSGEAVEAALDFAPRFAAEFAVPVHLYEASGAGRLLPSLRRGVPPPPDFGPAEPNPRWGRSVVGARGPLIAANLVFAASLLHPVREVAREMRQRRDAGDIHFLGVRTLAFELASRDECQLSLNLTRPDETSFDELATWAEARIGHPALRAELVGIIRRGDLGRSTRLPVSPDQIVG